MGGERLAWCDAGSQKKCRVRANARPLAMCRSGRARLRPVEIACGRGKMKTMRTGLRRARCRPRWARENARWGSILGCLVIGWRTAADTIDSLFVVDGMAVDGLREPLEIEAGSAFEGKLPRFPLVDQPKRYGRFTALLQQQPIEVRTLPQSGFQEQLMRAEAHIAHGEWAQAQRAIEEALEKAPNDLFLLRRAAALSALAGKYGVADTYFRRCVRANPEDITYVVGWAGVLIRLYRFDEAEKLVAEALSRDPKYLPARFNQAILRVIRDDVAGLEEAWVNLEPQEIDQTASWLLTHRKDLEPVMTPEGYEKLGEIVLGPGTGPHWETIRAELRAAGQAARAGDFTNAAAAYQRIGELGVRSYTPQMYRAIMLAESGDMASARTILEGLLARYPRETGLRYNMAYLCLRERRYADAAKILEPLHAEVPDSGDFAMALACAYAGQGQMDTAWPLLAELAERFPTRMDDWLEGEEPYLVAIRSDPRFPELAAKWRAPRLAKPSPR